MRLVWLTLAWCAGVWLASLRPQVEVWLGVGVVSTLILIWIFRLPSLRWAGVFFVAFGLGGLRMSIAPTTSDVAALNGRSLTLTGIVNGMPELRDDGALRFPMNVETVNDGSGERNSSGAVLIVARTLDEVRLGDRVAATGEMTTPPVIDDFDYAEYLARDGVYSWMPNATITWLSSGHANIFQTTIASVREQARTFIEQTLPAPASSFLRGVLLGEDAALAQPVQDRFAVTGTAHIIAISGFNLALVGGTLQRVLIRIGARKQAAAALSLFTVLTYAVFVGAEPAVMRAALMVGLVILGDLLRRQTFAPASVGFAALVLTAINPFTLWDVGFQLSAAATLGLAMLSMPIARGVDQLLKQCLPRRWAERAGDLLAEPLVASLAAQIAVLPLIALHFGRLSLVAPAVNLLIIPLQPLIVIIGGASVLIGLMVPVLGAIGLWTIFPFLSITLSVIGAFAALPFADTAFRLSAAFVLLSYAFALGIYVMNAAHPTLFQRFVIMLRSRALNATLIFAAFSIVVLTGAVIASRPDGNLHVWALDMNGANAVLVQTPGGSHMLIDGGSSPTRLLNAVGEILPFNKRAIDVLIMTAPIEANISALNELVRLYDIGTVITNGQPTLLEAYHRVLDATQASPQVNVTTGYRIAWDDGAGLEFLFPVRMPTITDGANEGGLVARLSFGNVSFLLTGELTPESQEAILESGVWPHATVMQMPRHAMPRSLLTAFLENVAPSAVFAQTQQSSRRGDADPDVLARLEGLPIMLTHESGTVHYWTDGSALWVAPERTADQAAR